ncbi:MAG: reverse transcriptase family protein, partial [Candidatus Omnitrophica bacterium]|nr:reverse transcriptase family protein [Candidatus Omnitrophota bacterium]
LSEKLFSMPMVHVNDDDTVDIKQSKIDDYLSLLTKTLHDSARESGCVSNVRPRKLYWCPQLQELKTRKRFWWSIWVQNDRPRNGVIFDCYKYVKKQFRRVSRQCVQRYLDNRAKNLSFMFGIGRSRSFWNGIKQTRQFKTHSLLDAHDFSTFYSGIMQDSQTELTTFQSDVKLNVMQVFNAHCDKTFSVVIPPRRIFDSLSNLRKGCAAGMDGITTEQLFFGRSDILCKHLSNFYSVILSSGIVPYCFTVGTIIPLLKKATLNPNLPSNYRPITLTSTFAKLAEMFLRPDQDELGLSNGQYGFREGRGTDFCTAMLNDVSLYCNEQHTPLYICSLDAEKCFDRIWHPGLFYKLIGKLPLAYWMFLYRWYGKLKAVVKWNGLQTPAFSVTRGTRQGSALSPVLFSIFINDLLLELEQSGSGGVRIGKYLFNFFAYADDVTLFSTTVTGLQHLIDICDAYSKAWNFNFGIKKTKCMAVGLNPFKAEPKWHLSGQVIENVELLDILGVIFDRHLTGGKHAEQRVSVCRKSFYSLAQCGLSFPSGLSTEAKVELLRCVCMPTLFYGCGSIYLSKGCLRKLNSFQGVITKRAFGLSKFLHHSPILGALEIISATDQVKQQTLNLMYRIGRVHCSARDLILAVKDTKGCLANRVVAYGVSLYSAILSKPRALKFVGEDGLRDSIRTVMYDNNFKNKMSQERIFLNALLSPF